MSKIKNITAREILDSRGNPTIETEVILSSGVKAKASVPSGASTGEHEAKEIRDGDKKRYNGRGVLKAISHVEKKILPKLKGCDATKQEMIDKEMIKLDGTKNKSKLGANTILSVSLAIARVSALYKKQELFEYISKIHGIKGKYKLPTPAFNIINGGAHADNNIDFQEFMILPIKKINGTEKIRMGTEIFHELGKILKKEKLNTNVGNEGGYAPRIHSSIQAVEFIVAAIINAGYNPGKDICIGIDAASSEFYEKKTRKYVFKINQAHFTNTTLTHLYYEWFRKFPIISIEDGLDQDDWEGWQELTRELGDEMLLIGDDIFATNVERLRKGLKEKVANAILIKPNQVGTLTETLECVKLAQKHNYKIMISHRSGETNDDFISDLAVGIGAEYIKAGAPSRGERLAKYNRLMKIDKLIK